MHLGKLNIEIPVVLAPMAGVTDLPFRVICREMGAGYTVSEMVSAKALLFNNVKTWEMLKIGERERPTAIQLFGSVPREVAKAGKIVEDSGADLIDFNMGCPVHKIVTNGEGSSLMRQPTLAYEILAALVDAVKIPVTVKCRSGWDADHINAVEIASLAEKAGVAAIAIHGRTREDFYKGQANWQIIKEVKEAVHIPVLGNGDIWSAVDGMGMLKETGCDGVMIARGAEGNPWIFSQMKDLLAGKTKVSEPDLDTKFALILRHLKDLIAFKGEYIGVQEMRRHVAAYIKGLPHAALYRNKFFQVNTEKEFFVLLKAYRKQLAE